MIGTSLQLVLKRTMAHLRLLSAVVVGVVLAVTILAASVVYFESLRDLALDRTLNAATSSELDVLVEAGKSPLNRSTEREINDVMEGTILNRLEPFSSGQASGVRSWTFFVDEPPPMVPANECPCRPSGSPTTVDGEPVMVECDCTRVSCITIPMDDSWITIIEGRRPQPQVNLPPEGEVLVVEAIIDRATADSFDLSIGSSMPARPHWDEINRRVEVEVVGIFEPTDPSEDRWRIYDESFGSRSPSLQFARFIVARETLLDGMSGYFPRMGADLAWFIDVEPETISAADTASIRNTIAVTNRELRAVVDGFVLRTDLPAVLLGFDTDLFYNRLPMFIVLILIVLVVLYYVVTLASLLVDSQRGEVALLRGRGATSRQILAVFVMEAALLSVLAVAVGPLLALAGVSLIGALPFYADLSGGELLPARLSVNVYRMALLGGVLSMAALFIPALRATKLGLLTDRRGRARPPRLAFIQRYYLDLGILGLVLFLFWQLSKQGSFVAVDLFGETGVNQLVLAVPAIFLVSAGLILLRLFPLVMDLLGRALSSRYGSVLAPPSIILGIWQMARNPAHHARLSLLLILTAGLGVFAASFASTLERGAVERALYESGADFRVTNMNTLPGGVSFSAAERLNQVEGVETASGVYRDTGSIIGGSVSTQFSVLGVDPGTVEDVAWSRDDFGGGTSFEDALSEIAVGEPGGLLLPEGTRWLSVTMRPLLQQQDVSVFVRLSDANNRWYTLPLGDLTPTSVDQNRFPCPIPVEGEPLAWCSVGASVWPQPSGNTPPLVVEGPLTLHAVGIANFQRGSISPGAIDIDEITAFTGTGDTSTVVEDFSSLDHWRVMRPSQGALGDGFTQAIDDEDDLAVGIGRFRWTQSSGLEARGIAIGDAQPIMPVLVSPSFLNEYGTAVGEQLRVSVDSVRIEVVVTGVMNYFPTLDPDQRPFMIADRDAFHERVNLGRATGERQPNEVWISAADPAGTGDGAEAGENALLRSIENTLDPLRLNYAGILDRSQMLANVSIDPLISAGWRALLGMAFFTVLVVSAIGFLVLARVSFNARRAELALLRTMGLSMRQLLSLVLLEQILVIGAAVALGIFMGAQLGNTIMPYLANSGEGGASVPPMLVEIDWLGFSVTFGLLTAVFGLVVGAILVSVYRMSIHRIMRMGEG